jgi:peptidylprolyl isomerase
MRALRIAVPISAVLVVLASSCGSGSSAPPTTPPGTTGPFASVKGAAGKRPRLKIPGDAPPATLQIEDLSSGSGAAAKAGDVLEVQYQGVSWSTGGKFDASWDRHVTYTFPLGQGQVIAGWDQGLVGLRVGGRRELVIPPSLAYGADGRPPTIAPNETLVFVVDLVSIQGSASP